MPALEARLAQAFDMQRLADQADPQALLAARGGEFTGLVTSAATGASAALIGALPNLRVISSFGVGLDKLDLQAARQCGIAVGYTPDVLNDCVADLALRPDARHRPRHECGRPLRVGRGAWRRRHAGDGHRSRPGARSAARAPGHRRTAHRPHHRAALSTGFDMPLRYHTRRPVDGLPWKHEPSLHGLRAPGRLPWC